MPAELYQAFVVLGIIIASSFCCWRTESLTGLHPTAKLGIQAGIVGLAGLAIGRVVHLI